MSKGGTQRFLHILNDEQMSVGGWALAKRQTETSLEMCLQIPEITRYVASSPPWSFLFMEMALIEFQWLYWCFAFCYFVILQMWILTPQKQGIPSTETNSHFVPWKPMQDVGRVSLLVQQGWQLRPVKLREFFSSKISYLGKNVCQFLSTPKKKHKKSKLGGGNSLYFLSWSLPGENDPMWRFIFFKRRWLVLPPKLQRSTTGREFFTLR